MSPGAEGSMPSASSSTCGISRKIVKLLRATFEYPRLPGPRSYLIPLPTDSDGDNLFCSKLT